jgi:hypothetical protein
LSHQRDQQIDVECRFVVYGSVHDADLSFPSFAA